MTGKDRKVETEELGRRVLGQDSQDKAAGENSTGRTTIKTCMTGMSRHDDQKKKNDDSWENNRGRTARKEKDDRTTRA
jgi:hypothetical protein